MRMQCFFPRLQPTSYTWAREIFRMIRYGVGEGETNEAHTATICMSSGFHPIILSVYLLVLNCGLQIRANFSLFEQFNNHKADFRIDCNSAA